MNDKIDYRYRIIVEKLNSKLSYNKDKKDIDSAVVNCIEEFNKNNKYNYIINDLSEDYWKRKEIIFTNNYICPDVHMLISWDTIYWQVKEIYYTYEKSEIQSYQDRLINLLSEILLYCYMLDIRGEKIHLNLDCNKDLCIWNDKTIIKIMSNKNDYISIENIDLLWKNIDDYKNILTKLMKIRYYLKSKLKGK